MLLLQTNAAGKKLSGEIGDYVVVINQSVGFFLVIAKLCYIILNP